MDKLQMAKALLSNPRYSNPGQTTTAYGLATSDSENGLVMVDLGGDTVSVDDDQSIECETTFKVYTGDRVIVSLIGADGSGKTPIIIGVVGRGDQQQTEIDKVKNYFWADDRGAHVSTIENSVEGGNVLLDSDSLDIRFGNSNSEDDQIVHAKFGKDQAYIAGIDGTKYWNVKDLRDPITGRIDGKIIERKEPDGLTYEYVTDFHLYSVEKVFCTESSSIPAIGHYAAYCEEPYTAPPQESHTPYGYSIDIDNSIVIVWKWNYVTSLPSPLVNSGYISITYTTDFPVFSYDEGIRSLGQKSGWFSKIQGFNNVASGFCSSAEGCNTVIDGDCSKGIGQYNKTTGALFVVGNGTSETDRNDAYVLDRNGIGHYATGVYLGTHPGVRYNIEDNALEYLRSYGDGAYYSYNLVRVFFPLTVTISVSDWVYDSNVYSYDIKYVPALRSGALVFIEFSDTSTNFTVTIPERTFQTLNISRSSTPTSDVTVKIVLFPSDVYDSYSLIFDITRRDPAVYTGTLLAASWTGNSAPYSYALTVNGLLATDKPIVDVVMSGTYSTDESRNNAWASIYRAVTSADTLTVYASELPTVDLPIQIQCVR